MKVDSIESVWKAPLPECASEEREIEEIGGMGGVIIVIAGKLIRGARSDRDGLHRAMDYEKWVRICTWEGEMEWCEPICGQQRSGG